MDLNFDEIVLAIIEIACDEYAPVYAELNETNLLAGKLRMKLAIMKGLMEKQGLAEHPAWQKVKQALAKQIDSN